MCTQPVARVHRRRSVWTAAGAAACALALISVGDARAAGAWSAAADIGSPGYVPNGLGFTSTGKGMLTLAWRSVGRPSLAAPVNGDDGFGQVSEFTRANDVFQYQNVGMGRQVAVFGRDQVVATGNRQTPPRAPPWVAFGRIGHRLGRREPLPIRAAGTVALAANARGDVALVAASCSGCPLYLLYRPHDGVFGRPMRIAAHAEDETDFSTGVAPAVAVNAAGDVVVAWGQRRVGAPTSSALYARIRHGRRWRSSAQRVGDLQESGKTAAWLSDKGDAVVGWWTQHADTGGGGSGPLAPPVYNVVSTGKTGRFRVAKRLDAGAAGPGPASGVTEFLPLQPRLSGSMAPSGRIRLAWTGADQDGPLARVATFDAGKLSPGQTLGRGSVAAINTDGHDRAVVLWGNATGVFASTALAGQPYAAVPELIDAQPTAAASPGDVSFDPRNGRVIAVWETVPPSNPGTADTWRPRWAVRSPLALD
jgi:hypothetical protein